MEEAFISAIVLQEQPCVKMNGHGREPIQLCLPKQAVSSIWLEVERFTDFQYRV